MKASEFIYVKEAKVEMCPEACCGQPVTECKCGPDCEHCDCYNKNKEDVKEGFLSNLVGDVRNAFKPGVQVTPNMVKELEAGLAAIKAGGQPTPRQQKIFDRFMSDTLAKELQTNTLSSRQTLNVQSKGGVEKDNYTSHARDYDSKKGLTTNTVAQQFDGSTTDRFIMPGGSGIQTTTGADGSYKEKKIQMKGPQSWAYDKPKLNASKKVREETEYSDKQTILKSW